VKINGVDIDFGDKVRIDKGYCVYTLELLSTPSRCGAISQWGDSTAPEILLVGRRLTKKGYPDSRCNVRLPVIAKPEEITKLRVKNGDPYGKLVTAE
jgi:hypothetical protein